MALNCGTCRKPILEEKGSIKCTGNCKQHFHISCTPIQSEENITKLGAKVEQWECPKCVKGKSENLDSFVDEVVTRSALEDIIGQLKIGTSSQKIDDILRELIELKKSLSILSKQVNEFKYTVSHIEDEIGHLQTENSRLQTKNSNLWRTVVRLGDELNDAQQRRCSRAASLDNQSTEGVESDIISPKGVIALGLSYLTFAGILFLITSRLYKGVMAIMRNDSQEL